VHACRRKRGGATGAAGLGAGEAGAAATRATGGRAAHETSKTPHSPSRLMMRATMARGTAGGNVGRQGARGSPF